MSADVTEERFLRDVAQHKMTVIKDDGVHRHLHFAKPGTSCMHFDLITWPGYLCYTGDMGTYVFTRLRDMFEFFRTDREYAKRRGKELAINPSYWGEKLEAVDKCDGFKQFSEEKFNAAIREYFVSWVRDHRGDTSKEERRELWEAIECEVLGADGDGGGYRKQCAAHDFYHEVNRAVGNFRFEDFWETNVEEYSHRFMWCCYALAWGIQQYDDAKDMAQIGVAA
jgi:hypothetical protein